MMLLILSILTLTGCQTAPERISACSADVTLLQPLDVSDRPVAAQGNGNIAIEYRNLRIDARADAVKKREFLKQFEKCK
jgi:hypothetical protein